MGRIKQSIAVFFFLLALLGCSGREIERSVSSPDKKYIAEINLIRGFTHDIELVSIRSANPGLRDIIGSRKDLFRLSSHGKLSASWKSNSVLLIKCNPCDMATTVLAGHWRDVSVTYDVAPLEWKREDDQKAK